MEKSLTVTRLVRRMRNLLEIEIGEVWVEGEISNLRKQASGHSYFTLKDEGAQISCVLFRGSASRAKAIPQDGMQARIFAEVSLYETRGQLQLIVKQVEDAGLGDLQARFEALKKKLNTEGLFDPAHKLALPDFPKTVGIVTSGTGAALQDMLNVLSRRAPWIQPILYPVTVQGAGAELSIARAINELSNAKNKDLPEVDVIIVGRGGGSLEDLWNFNEEVVVRAIFDCKIPIVSAVGHEIDFTISDFAADMRAPTPSAAAELVVPDGEELRARVKSLSATMSRTLEGRLRHDLSILNSARRALMPRDAERALRDPIQELDRCRDGLRGAVKSYWSDKKSEVNELKRLHESNKPSDVMDRRAEKVARIKLQLEKTAQASLSQLNNQLAGLNSLIRTLGPQSTFNRGFSLTTDENGKIIKNAAELSDGDLIQTRLAEGKLLSEVKKKRLTS